MVRKRDILEYWGGDHFLVYYPIILQTEVVTGVKRSLSLPAPVLVQLDLNKASISLYIEKLNLTNTYWVKHYSVFASVRFSSTQL